jgi:hypothetical protein
MKTLKTIWILIVIIFISCEKKEIIPDEPPRILEPWEKYIGNYLVYDTLGNFMYDIDISYFSGTNPTSGHTTDSLLITNFADTFDIKFQFLLNYTDETLTQELLNIQFHDSIVDYNNKMWYVGTELVDASSSINENSLIKDTIVFYFEMNNINFYIPEAQPFFFCECKHMAVKQ